MKRRTGVLQGELRYPLRAFKLLFLLPSLIPEMLARFLYSEYYLWFFSCNYFNQIAIKTNKIIHIGNTFRQKCDSDTYIYTQIDSADYPEHFISANRSSVDIFSE